MRTSFLPLFIFALVLAAPCFGGDGSSVMSVNTAGGTVHKTAVIGINRTLIVELDTSARDVLVSNPDIADAVVKNSKRVYLMAKKIGQTDAFFSDGAGHRLLVLDIRVEKDPSELSALLHESFPDASIDATVINGAVVLSGSVKNPLQSAQAQDIANRYIAEDKGGGVNSVVNMLQVASGEQVMLKVRIAEVQRSVAKQLGVDLTQAATTIGATTIAASTSNPYGIAGAALSDLSKVQVSNGNLSGTLKALETVGLMHTLAEPNLIAVSGETAKFLAGGEFPVPSGRDTQGNVSITFKQFGVGLAFTPVVLGSGRISLQLSTEVSELTNTGSYTMSGGTGSGSSTTIPALSVRRAETTVELPSGGSFAIAGLMQHTTKQQLDGFPGLKDMPILGALFRSRDFQNDETELVVLVTTYLVSPVQEAKLALPTDGFVVPADPETLLLGRLNAVYGQKQKLAAPQGPVGFIVQ
jgi:pilus assembly protein CpaC